MIFSKSSHKKGYKKKISSLDDTVNDVVQRSKSSVDMPTWISTNRWIYGDKWSYESVGPLIEYGNHDKPIKRLNRPYLYAYLRDKTRTKSIIKSRQSELTENSINEALYYCITRPHTKVSHIFPTDELGDAISREKIRPAINESPDIYKYLSGQGAVRSYEFNTGGLYTISGALKKAGGRASSRDMIIWDETDQIAESVFGVFEEVLSHSPLRLRRYLSTPTVPGIGIHKRVSSGCEYEWTIKCHKCKKEQIFTWPDNIINYFHLGNYEQDDPDYIKKLKNTYIGCKFCKAYIDRNTVFYEKTSKWIPKKPNLVNDHASYHLNAMMIAWKTGCELVRKVHELADYEWQAQNEILGYAYVKSEGRLTDNDILECVAPWQMLRNRISVSRNLSAGIDWGEKSSWIVIIANGIEVSSPDKACVIYIEEINSETLKINGFRGKTTDHVFRVKQLVDLFGCEIVVNDANGMGIDRNKYLIDQFNKRAWGCFFDTAEMGKQIRHSRLQIPTWSDGARRVTISKVNTLKEIHNLYRRRMLALPAIRGNDTDVIRKFIEHCKNLAIQPKWNSEYGREYEVVVKVGVHDHFCDALMYAKIGNDKLTGGKSRTPGIIMGGKVSGAVRIGRTLGV